MITKRIILILLMMLVLSYTLFPADLDQFGGTWKNVDPNTRGITTLEIHINGETITLQAWGKCLPEDCDMGKARAMALTHNISTHPVHATKALITKYSKNYSEEYLIIRMSGNNLVVEAYTRFTDQSGRSNFRSVYTFEHPRIVDNDHDSLDDNQEMRLLKKYAPQVRLHSADWCKPASISWFLPRTTMRYTHRGCSDCEIIKFGSVTNSTITRQKHQNKSGFPLCNHKGDFHYSNNYQPADYKTGFFLQQEDNSHGGCSDTSMWEVYGHAYPGKNGMIILQYWFFYAYNDSFGKFNHEGDWEHIDVVLDRNEKVRKYGYSQHNGFREYTLREVKLVGTHPVVYAAKGSHANYAACSGGDCTDAPFYDNCNNSGPRWNTWTGDLLINVGEKGYPLNGATWLQYSGRWGEIGSTSITSGPTGPAWKPESWNRWR